MRRDVPVRPAGLPGRERVPVVVYVLALCVFSVGTSEFMVAGILPDMAADLAVTIPEAGYLISAFAVGMIVGAPVTAALTLQLPRRTTLLAALAVVVAGHLAGALAPDYGVVLVTRVVSAVATGAFWAIAGVVTVSSVGPRARARALSVMLAGLTVANIAGVPLGAVLGQAFGWRAPFWAVAALAVAGIAGVLLSVPGGGPVGERPRLASELAVFRRGQLWLAIATIAFYAAALTGMLSYLAPLLVEVAGIDARWIPAVLLALGVGSFAGVLLGGRLGDAHPWPTLFGALGGVGALMGLTALFAGVPVAVVVLVLLLGGVSYVAAAPLNARVYALAGAAPTLASAANTAAFNIGNAIGPAVGGLAIAAGWGYTSPAWLGVVLIAAAAAVALLARHRDGGRAVP